MAEGTDAVAALQFENDMLRARLKELEALHKRESQTRQAETEHDGRERSALKLTTDEHLRQSEARYRALFENIDAGFCICDVKFDKDGHAVDHLVLEANPAFERYTGLKNAVGRYATEVAPGIEQHWHDAYGKVAKTGQPLRFEAEAVPLGRW